MPWKGERNPYRVWLSEIILQQTRVDQGLAYYQQFVAKFPTIKELASAPESEVFKLWEGLGYYSRCKNLMVTAKKIYYELDGKFPSTYEGLLQLKGVGAYTAAAIASFAFDLPYAVSDGNVYRVLSRFFGVSTAIDSAKGKKFFQELAQQLLPSKEAATFNQAIMDFGALVCKPAMPDCKACVMNNNCVAFKEDRVKQLPVKEKKLQKKTRWMYFIAIKWRNGYYVQQRTEKDIWQNLYEFACTESAHALSETEMLQLPLLKKFREQLIIKRISERVTQVLTHQVVHGQVIFAQSITKIEEPGLLWKSEKDMQSLAFSGIVRKIIAASAEP